MIEKYAVMKKFIFTLLLVTAGVMSGVSHANNSKLSSLCDEWNILSVFSDLGPGETVYQTFHYRLSVDTIIEEQRYIQLEEEGKYIGAMREGNNADIYYIPAGSTYEFLIYAFNAKVGDKLDNLWFGGNLDDSYYIESAEVADIESSNPKRYVVKITCKYNDTSDIIHRDLIWIEGVGLETGPVGYDCIDCEGGAGSVILCANKEGKQIYTSEYGDEYGCEYNAEPVKISLYQASELTVWDGITGVESSSRDTLQFLNETVFSAVLEGHSLTIWPYEYEGKTDIQLFSLADNSIVYSNQFEYGIGIHMTMPGAYMIVMKNSQVRGLILGRVDFEVSLEEGDVTHLTILQTPTIKFLRDSQILILRNNKTYTITGQRIE